MKRRLLIIAMFLLLGVVVNVAVAWGFALFVDPTQGQYDTLDAETENGYLSVGRISRFGTVTVVAVRIKIHLGNVIVPPEELHLIPPWSQLLTPTARYLSLPKSSEERRTMEARGWPMLALSCELRREYSSPMGSSTEAVRAGIKTPLSPWWVNPLRPRVLPLHPLWAGVIFNTLIYATLLWLLICGLFALRRFLRVRRGLCPKCAYPMGESAVCTECGRLLPKRVAT